MADPQAVRAAWRGLGRQLAAKRKAAKLSQQVLADQTWYSRSSIANIETGFQQINRTFWEEVDDLLGAGGELVRGYDAADALRRTHQRPAINNRGIPVDTRVGVSTSLPVDSVQIGRAHV